MKKDINSPIYADDVSILDTMDIKAITSIENPTNEDSLDLSKLTYSDIFNYSESEDGFRKTELIQYPIFEVEGRIHYATPLKTITKTSPNPKENQQIPLVGIYGLETILGLSPIPFNINNNLAEPIAIVDSVGKLINSNQQGAIEMGIREALENGKNLKKDHNIWKYESPLDSIGPIVDELRDKLKYYLKLRDDLEYDIATCFILGTYLFPLFPSFGYLIISGEKGSGKGTFLDFLEKTCWNPTPKQINSTGAVLFRRIEQQRPTLIIDEYHRITYGSSGNDIITIMEAGFDKGAVVSRAKESKEEEDHVIVDYSVYCPKVLATRKPVEADAKGIKLLMPKRANDEKYAKRKKELYNDKFFNEVRKWIMNWTISNQELIIKAFDEIDPVGALTGREFTVWLPVLAISKVAFPDKHDLIKNYASQQISKIRSDTYEKENLVLNALYYLHEDNILLSGGKKLKVDSYKVTNKEIKETVQEIEDTSIHHASIKSALDNLNIVGKTNRGTYYIKKEELLTKFVERELIKESNAGIILNSAEKTSKSENSKIVLSEMDKEIFSETKNLGTKAKMETISLAVVSRNTDYSESDVRVRISLLYKEKYLYAIPSELDPEYLAINHFKVEGFR